MVLQVARDPGSLKYVWAQAIEILNGRGQKGAQRLAEAVGLSVSAVYSSSRPGEDYIIADLDRLKQLDVLCAQETGGERLPFMEWWRREVMHAATVSDPDDVLSLTEEALHASVTMAKVSEDTLTIRQHLATHKLTRRDFYRLATDAAELEHELAHLTEHARQAGHLDDVLPKRAGGSG